MADVCSSSSRPRSPKLGDWERCSVSHSRLVKLQTKGFLPPAYMVPVRAGLATYNGGEQAESFPSPSMGERVCLVPYLLRGSDFQFIHSSVGSWSSTASNYTISPLPPFYISPAMLLSASCSWAARLTSSCGKGYFASSLAHRGGHFIKWAEPKYGASPIPDTCPVPRRSCPKTALQNGFIWTTFPFRPLFSGVFLSSTMLL